MPELAKHLNHFTESVIREMTRVSDAHNAINLSQGFPDFDPPPELIDAAKRALAEGYNQYAVTWGAPGFRQALARKQRVRMGADIDPDAHIVVTCGGTEAMMAAMMTVCNPGDKVIVFSPFYENYGADTILSGAKPVYVPLHPPEFGFDPDELRRAFEQGVKALVLCNPSNPAGKVFTREELHLIADLAQEFDTFVITDEVYEHIVYPPHEHVYMASLPGMFERTLSTSSLSKTYSVTGWRLGYVIGPERVISGARKIHDFLTVGAAAPLQQAAITGLNFSQSYYDELQAGYVRRRSVFLDYLDRAGLKYTRPQGAYYVLADISDFGFKSDTEFCYWMARDIGVAAVPGSSFFHEPVSHLIRFHFAKKEETLRQAGERLMRLKEKV
ncbi:aminotransferase [Desulfonema ishimotonii]|uniref:Aminotransferase n=1 Tax=Desulfonema ishimotonii TaxID=45657 RepID=A0A401G3V5_9BACT|nr:aminotransferase class I/II-fold pyridoxal phosphate-dependent enzyme [Desulfonema ishimotonii]GBC63795.1 aminotransferase [Desulfonema ishimotonii]